MQFIVYNISISLFLPSTGTLAKGITLNSFNSFQSLKTIKISINLFKSSSKLDVFHDFILQCLDSGWSKSKTVKAVYKKGYSGSKSNAFHYLVKIEEREGKSFEPQPYIRARTEALKCRTGSTGK